MNPAVAKKLLASLTRLIELVPEGRRARPHGQVERVLRGARSAIESPSDVASFERSAERMPG